MIHPSLHQKPCSNNATQKRRTFGGLGPVVHFLRSTIGPVSETPVGCVFRSPESLWRLIRGERSLNDRTELKNRISFIVRDDSTRYRSGLGR